MSITLNWFGVTHFSLSSLSRKLVIFYYLETVGLSCSLELLIHSFSFLSVNKSISNVTYTVYFIGMIRFFWLWDFVEDYLGPCNINSLLASTGVFLSLFAQKFSSLFKYKVFYKVKNFTRVSCPHNIHSIFHLCSLNM